MALGLTIPGAAGGPPLVFTVKGQSAGNWAAAFSNAIKGATGTILQPDATPAPAGAGRAATFFNEIVSNTTGGASAYTLPTGGEYTADVALTQTTINGATGGAGDTVVALAYTTYNANGGNNNVTFVLGDNVFNGAGDSVGGDTVTGSAGFDTINTGSANTTVFSGAGGTLINLNDTGTSSATGDLAWLGDGQATVHANGGYDNVITGVSGQLIEGGSVAASTLNVVIESKTGDTSFGGNNTIAAGAGTTNVFDTVGGNTIYGGSGNLDFIGGVGGTVAPASGSTVTGTAVIADTIVSGAGQVVAFGAANVNLTFASSSGNPILVADAGAGNETLNAANALGGAELFASGDSKAAATINDTFYGGNYFNYFQTGAGNEAITAGTGENILGIATTGSAAHITIFDFAASSQNYVEFLGMQDSVGVLNGGTVSGGNLTLTLSDNTTVTFVGVTDLTGKLV